MRPMIKECRHGTFMFYNTDEYVGRSLEYYGDYSETEWNLYSQFLKENMLIIDGGANMGAFTVPFGKTVGRGGRVVAFEPQLELYQLLIGNIVLNELSNIVIPYCAALGDKDGDIDMTIVNYDIAGNYGGLRAGENPQFVMPAENMSHLNYRKVPLMTIDGLKLPGCSFIKLDIEGMETEAIKGATETIREYHPALYVENNDSEKSPELIQTIWDLDYNCWWDVSPLSNTDNYFGYKEELFKDYGNINMLCFHKEKQIRIHGGDEESFKVTTLDAWKKKWPGREG